MNDDGSFVSAASKKALRFYSKDYELIWEKKLMATHQINKTTNGDYLVMQSENKNFQGKIVRFDSFLRINEKGETVGEFNVYNRLQELEAAIDQLQKNVDSFSTYNLSALARLAITKKDFYLRKLEPQEKNLYGADFEPFHANSIYELGEGGAKHQGLKADDLIINLAYRGIFLVVSSDLKNIVRIIPAPSAFTHDIHFLPNGDLFVYNNNANYILNSFVRAPMQSAVQIYRYPQMDLLREVGSKENEKFFSYCCGGGTVMANGDIYYSSLDDDKKLAYLNYFNKETGEIRKTLLGELNKLSHLQEVKVRDMSLFLGNNKKLSEL